MDRRDPRRRQSLSQQIQDEEGQKVRENVLTVREDHRIDSRQADSLFKEIERRLGERFE